MRKGRKKGSASIREQKARALELEHRCKGLCLVNINEKANAKAQIGKAEQSTLNNIRVRWLTVIFVAGKTETERYFRTIQIRSKIPHSMVQLETIHSGAKNELIASFNAKHIVSTGFIAIMGKDAPKLTDKEIDALLEAHNAWDVEQISV